MPRPLPTLSRQQVVRHWLELQGHSRRRGEVALTKARLRKHLEQTGGLQLDSISVLERAHLLTLWSRFGNFDRAKLDRWLYQDRVAFDYWAHEASIMPASHLPIAMRRMRGFPSARTKSSSYWPRLKTSGASKRRVLRRLRDEGPLESVDFKRDPGLKVAKGDGWSSLVAKEDSRSLRLLWHSGRVAVTRRRHFRKVYDLAERVYPDVLANAEPVSKQEFEDSWLLRALQGCGAASEAHLRNYITGPSLLAQERSRVLRRQIRAGRVVEVEVESVPGTCYVLAEHLDRIAQAPEPEGTTLICPFDSLLWQRQRARDLLDFEYTVEIYVPAAKRRFGYYVLPILHDGRLVGRLDPKLHRDRAELEIVSIHLESAAERTKRVELGLRDTLEDLAGFVGADSLKLPRGWRRLL